MDHQAQGLALVDGEWVSRPLDLYQIMGRARQEDKEIRDPITKPPIQVPEYGVLSRTIFASPLSKVILPANIRHKDLTDMVLVAEDSVQLKEIRDYGHIRHVETKTDFNGGRILAAKVFGDPREVPKFKGLANALPMKHIMRRERRSTSGDEEQLLPPEVIVLTLSTRKLLFLWAQQTQTGATNFIQKSVKLPAGSSRFDRFGPHLAIDPKRRAIAVAAHEGRFILYKTKSMDRWRQEARHGSDTTPIEDERIISIKGRIMHMDFLSSGGGSDDFHVVLLFFVVHHGNTKITCFDWDCRQDLSKATARTERVQVDPEDRSPSLLIPLRRSPDFLLVSDTHISVYKDVLSGLPKRTRVPIQPNILAPLRPGDSKRRPRWTAWDQTPRNAEFSKEAFYIAREDGRIMYAARGSGGSMELDDAGEWPYRIDTAFACLNVDNSESSQQYPDVLIAGGASNDGLICKVGSWPTEYSYDVQYPGTNQFSYVESIPNWTPLADFSVTPLSGPRAPDERQRSSIFIANGNSPHGEISELRHGIQALVDDSFGGLNGCAGIWVVDHGISMVEIDGVSRRQHYAVFAITLPPETLVIRIVRTQPESRADFTGAWEHGLWEKSQLPTGDEPVEDSLIRDAETISACPWSDRVSVQITTHEARILHRTKLRQSDSISFDAPLLLAASRTAVPFVAFAYRETGVTYLEIVRISRSGTFERAKDTRHKLASDPTCIEILDIGGSPCVFVSTFDSHIMLFKVDDRGVSFPVIKNILTDVVPNGAHMRCESAVVLNSRAHRVLVCAMRDGSLVSASIAIEQYENSTLLWESVRIGSTPAKISRSETDTSVAFVSCGSDFCRVRCSAHDTAALKIDSIWFTNRKQPDYVQKPVTALYQLPFLPNMDSIGRNLGGFLFAVVGDQLLSSQLESDVRSTSHDVSTLASYDAKAVPRKVMTGAKPTKILHMKSLRRVLVSTMEAKEERAPPDSYRVLHSSIKLLRMHDDKPVNDAEVKQEDGDALTNRHVIARFSLKHAERVYSIIEWPFANDQGKKYSLLIVGTGIQVGPNKHTGRRLVLTTGKTASKLETQKESSYDQPVYCIALWDNETTISVTGTSLIIERYDSHAGRFERRGRQFLQSPGVHVSVNRPFVYVSTLSHSHICYKVVNSTREDCFDFVPVFTDSRERQCSHHLVMDLPRANGEEGDDRFVLLTDKNSGSISALFHPPERTYKNASDTLFEAFLPRAVVRLDRGDIRPPWRRANGTGNITGVITDDILGACTDGTIFSFSILTQSARYLLRLMQNLVEVKSRRNPLHQDSITRPRSGDIFSVLMNGAEGNQEGEVRVLDVDPRHLEKPSAKGPRHKHIDGDLLLRWLEEGGDVEWLVWEDTDAGIGALFKHLALDVEGSWGSKNGGGTREEDKELYACVRRWVGELLMPVL
ncbi:hypothetical protein EJ02DRAFT_241455 [Clathrospora elynae]|uniref:Cleavage/polyadenylation specificity factor A subunit N-terminal domain-containing protein n=1 Tax=Clathrospora elynae TaxID=706981 RepID=A0A6A5SJP5_9PLEO|nr:hypothetical protein EJ02DRAFT_241455 [Clathrospora elynae]